jgi:hypothetical protein
VDRLGQATIVVVVVMLALTAAEQGFGAQPLPLTG